MTGRCSALNYQQNFASEHGGWKAILTQTGRALLLFTCLALPWAGAGAQGFPPAGTSSPPGLRSFPPLGNRCEALFATAGGPHRVICGLPQPQPVRARCLCSPVPPPGYPKLGPVGGRVIP